MSTLANKADLKDTFDEFIASLGHSATKRAPHFSEEEMREAFELGLETRDEEVAALRRRAERAESWERHVRILLGRKEATKLWIGALFEMVDLAVSGAS